MPNVINSPERHRYIEVTIQHTQELLEDPAAQAELDVFGPDIARLAASLFIPNVRNDRLVLPQEYSAADAYPIIALQPGEHIGMGFLKPSPEQIQVNRKVLSGIVPEVINLETIIQHSISNRLVKNKTIYKFMNKELYLNQGKGAVCAFTGGLFFAPDARRYFFSRPVLALAYKQFEGEDYHPWFHGDKLGMAEALPHELTHLRQKIKETMALCPEDTTGIKARRELEAYHVGATVARVALEAGAIAKENTSFKSQLIEVFRKAYNPPEAPFELSPRLYRALLIMGLNECVVYERSSIVR